jgi:hypothetical protein
LNQEKHGGEEAKDGTESADKDIPQRPISPTNPPHSSNHRAEAQQNSEPPREPSFKIATFIAAVIAAVAAVFAAFFTGWQVMIARDTFNYTNRPYIGVSEIYVSFYREGKAVPPGEASQMDWRAEIKNYGTMPGTQFKAKWRNILSGNVVNGKRIPDSPLTLFPTETTNFEGSIRGPLYFEVSNGTVDLTTEVRIDYFGPNGLNQYCEKFQYTADLHQFINLGARCDPQ